MIAGQDWASYQGPSPDTSGLDFVFIKVTQGLTYENPYWQQQVKKASRAGLVVGLYHYPDMRNGAGIECERFCTVAANALSSGPLMAMLDWEGYDPDNQGVSHADQAAYKDAFLEHLALLRPRNRTVLYANLDYWRDIDTSGRFGDALFIATAGLPAGHPGIATPVATPWTFHQWGTRGGIDEDVANFPSRAALAAWADKQEADMPLTPEDVRNVWGYSHTGTDGHADAPDVHQTLQNAQDAAKAANAGVAALSVKVDAIAKTLATQPQGGATAAELQAAAEAGAEAAINKFLASLTIKTP